MAKEKPIFKHKFDTGEAMALPWNLPGGRNFLWRILIWGAGLLLMVYAVFGRKFISAYADFIIQTSEFNSLPVKTQQEQMPELLSMLLNLMGPAVLLGLVAWLVFIMVETAMHKNLFRGTDHGAFPLRFGKDELRVLIAQLVIFACVSFFYIFGVFAVVFIALLLTKLGGGSALLGAITGVMTFIAIIAFTVFLFRLLMGWAPAAAMSVRDNKQRIFDGWAIAKGRNWPLFGTYVVVTIVGYFATYIVMGVGGFIAFGNLDFMVLFVPETVDPAAVINQLGDAIKQPRVMVPLVIFTIIYALTAILWYIHFWAIGSYTALLDAKEKGLMG